MSVRELVLKAQNDKKKEVILGAQNDKNVLLKRQNYKKESYFYFQYPLLFFLS